MVDAWVAAILAPLAIAILISAIDDLLVDAAWLVLWLRGGLNPLGCARTGNPRARIAIFVPAWREHRVIARMLEHNLNAAKGPADFFVGAYRNDPLTQTAVREVQDRFPNVHLAVCTHDGPTSKADCLNWIFQHMLVEEERSGSRFDIVVTHDAEDVMHPQALDWIDFYCREYDMVQVPVLALPTRATEFTHGVYCDEFAEYQTRDMPVRAAFGAFVPSNGVGTGYRRDVLERLALEESNLIFNPAALTEDYEIGLRLHRIGAAQAFVPIQHAREGSGPRDFVATREYFPRRWRAAVRQRTRWVTGNALQSWHRYGWRGTPATIYWLWRDRKGILSNPLSLAANIVFLYGCATWTISRWSATTWSLAETATIAMPLILATLCSLALRIAFRAAAVARIYGWRCALWVPVRIPWANLINAEATIRAVAVFAWARARGHRMPWLKTEHAYPSRAALAGARRPIGEILAGMGSLSGTALENALANRPAGRRIGEHLLACGLIQPKQLYEALSMQSGLFFRPVDPREVPRAVAQSLPAAIVQQWNVLPIRISAGHIHLATPEIPTDEAASAIAAHTSLDPRYQLVTPGNFGELKRALVRRAAGAG